LPPAAVRSALGGPRLESIRSLVLEGDAQIVLEHTHAARREVRIARPSNYLVIDHFPSVGVTTGIGLRNNTLFRISGPGVSLASKEAQQVFRRYAENKIRREATLLLAALLMTTDTPVPIKYVYAGRAESPDGVADAIDISWAEGLTARLFVATDTKLPLMVAFEDLEIHKDPKPKSLSELPFVMPQFDKVPHALYFSDYRRVDGVMIPHTQIHAVAGATKEQFTVTRARVNVPGVLDAFPK
jgi:hypothetical protein